MVIAVEQSILGFASTALASPVLATAVDTCIGAAAAA